MYVRLAHSLVWARQARVICELVASKWGMPECLLCLARLAVLRTGMGQHLLADSSVSWGS